MINRQTQNVAMACPSCYSCNIARDAAARWDVSTQRWTLRGVQDHMTCEACGAEFYEPSERAVNETLFNCCSSYAEPDWSKFKWLEIAPCRTVKSSVDDGLLTRTCSPIDADFWTVYGREVDGCVMALTDTSTLKFALLIAQRIKGIGGIEGETAVFA